MVAVADKGKGKQKAVEPQDVNQLQLLSSSDSESASSSSSSSDSESDDSDSDNEIETTKSYLDSLIENAKQAALAKEAEVGEEDILTLESERQLPLLDPGLKPGPYLEFGNTRQDPTKKLDPDAALAEKDAGSLALPHAPPAPPELTKSGKPLTKKERKALKHLTAGPDWFDLPAPPESDLPRLAREVEALRLRNQLDPKRFYKKEEGEGKGVKGLPKYFAIGKIVTTDTPFGGPTSENLTRGERKRTLVDELVDDAEAKRYAKRKFEDLQSVRGARGRDTLRAKQALRRGKW
ncbi:Fcf2-domain-containing protein [Coprinopsis marcescibilis]|uniref:Fcf2-domain-containing protein n=1 Tax=Coprinopsis marcescibilis TaxID=230819 RepID=A0A5C3L5N9_COPMA|nr:Fcf2-domain-containing protein [Coprinopsis marcescibilis]